MDFSELVRKRQSDRRYEERAVPRELVMRCIEAARLAPSACNSQPWHFVAVDDPQLKARLARAAEGLGMNRFAAEAPVIVAVVLEKMNVTARIGSMLKRKDYSLLDVGIAVEHFCLQAAELGLGTCILGWFDESQAALLLGVPRGRRIPLLVTVAIRPPRRARRCASRLRRSARGTPTGRRSDSPPGRVAQMASRICIFPDNTLYLSPDRTYR